MCSRCKRCADNEAPINNDAGDDLRDVGGVTCRVLI